MNISGDGVRLKPLIANDSYKQAFLGLFVGVIFCVFVSCCKKIIIQENNYAKQNFQETKTVPFNW